MNKLASQEPSETQKSLWVPRNDEDRTSIREQLDRIAASPMFKNSVRCTSLLRYIVERSLNGNVNHTKERTIGIEAFGRDATYDTNEDPVVRNTAVAVRRRLAQYYGNARPEDEIRIDLPAGGYTPEFRMLTKEPPIERSRRVPQKWLVIAMMAAGVVVTLAGLIFWLTSRTSSDALDKFWNPTVNSSDRVLICIGGVTGTDSPGATQQNSASPIADSTARNLSVRLGAYADSLALSRMAGLMMTLKKQFQVRLQSDMKLEDFTSEPVILIGGVTNQWTKRVLSELRFHFENDEQTTWISDRLNPNKRNWSTVRGETPEKSVQGYAVISRISDPTIGEHIVSIAGLSALATDAAAAFLSERTYMQKLVAREPKSWDLKNVQIVISMKLDGSSYGPPNVEAVHYW
jgi:hypothetical protein